jgi:hypothetical protein
MKRLFILIFVIIISLQISGCISNQSDPPNEEDSGDESKVLMSDTIKTITSSTGEVEISYKYIKELKSGKSANLYYNLSLYLENKPDKTLRIAVRYEEPQEGGYGSGGRTTMTSYDDQYYHTNIHTSDSLDLWFYFYEEGEMAWNETYERNDPTFNLKEIISAVIFRDYKTSEMIEKLSISEIRHEFDSNNSNNYNISYSISGSSDPELIILHYDIDFSEPILHPFREVIYGDYQGRYYSVITFNESELDLIKTIYFSIAISDDEYNRITSDVITVNVE